MLCLFVTKAAFLHLSARTLQLKIYYQLQEFDLLENLLESMRVYLQRSKGLAYRREHYNNILTFTRQLLQLPVMDKKEKEFDCVEMKNQIQAIIQEEKKKYKSATIKEIEIW